MMARRTQVWVLAGVIGWLSAAHAQDRPQATHPFSVHDMLAMDRISDPQVAPDQQTIAFVVRRTDLEADRGRSDVWLTQLDGGFTRPLTTDPADDFNPQWSSDGSFVWFLSDRSGSTQVWRIPARGGEAQQVTDFPLDIGVMKMSPAGTHLIVSMEVFPGLSVEETKKRLDERAARKSSGRIYDHLFIRHWDTWKDGRRAHLFAVPLPDAESNERSFPLKVRGAVDLMAKMDADCPTKPFGGPEDFTISPDGKWVVFSARDVGHEEAWSTDFDLYAVPVDGSRPPRCLTARNEAWDAHPVFSPDGSRLAYLAMRRPGYESDRRVIQLMDWPNGPVRALPPAWDRSPISITFDRKGKMIYTTANDRGQRPLFRVEVATGKVTALIRKGWISSIRIAGEHLVFRMDHLRSPVELYRRHAAHGMTTPITHLNDKKLAAVRMGEPEQFTFAGWNGETVYAYVVKPIDFDPNKKYPVAFLIHGGPQGSFGNHFHYRWNPQVYAGAGYAAVMVDFHGSTGYGQAFCDSIRGDWGGKPLEDLKKGLAAALERYPWMDGKRVAALGASFGGYMINWIAGQWPDRFRCLVNHDGNLDERAAYFMTEELWFPEWDHEGTPWENPESYEKHNPLRFVQNWKTPMLVIHGGRDYRVVDTQGIATFTALQRRGIPSRFLYFPDENHWVLKPNNSILWHETVLDWLNRWTR